MQLAEAEKQSNFLVPNGTFFVELIIFLVVLGIIWFFVVPSITKVLDEREAMIDQTVKDQRGAAKGFSDAESEYNDGVRTARAEAGSIRDDARATGRAAMEEQKQRATADAEALTRQETEQLRGEGEASAAAARGDLAPLSATLASRVLGFDVTQDPKLKAELDQINRDSVVKN
ncbi:F0F1 ATP synthase subunit B [Tsukamurella pseudospumae]|uniref:ATP synthase subunit b n=1 Tax=Tsukamurella pseudospumae TaxID=239498 RepID=A0A137YSB8_9ACTN|nr:F0F1 ATP synthase subunit B [Tsukamurella pseudospumae]KXO88808.1 ATP synthase F0F1 subunit B [Tsukamurella pseudospumae]